MSDEKKISFTVRCKNFFGLLPGKSIRDFAAEMKALTYEDKVEFCAAFNANGMPTLDPAPPK